MSLQFDPTNNRPRIQLDDGSIIQCHGEVPQEVLVERGETPEFLQDRCEQLMQLCYAAGFSATHIRVLGVCALRFKKYDPEEAAKVLIRMANLIDKYKLFGNVDTLRHVFEQGLVWFLPRRCKDGSVGIVMEAGKTWDPSKVPLLDLCTALRFAQQAMMMDERVHFSCMKLIIDYEGVSLKQCMQYKPKILKILMEVQHICMTEREVHIVNNPKLFDTMFQLSISWIDKKIKQEMFFHGTNYDSFHQHVDPECLPAKYGGTAQDYDHRLAGELMISMKDKFYESKFT